MASKKKRPLRAEVFEAPDGLWYWTLLGLNGDIVAFSEHGFARHRNAKRALTALLGQICDRGVTVER